MSTKHQENKRRLVLFDIDGTLLLSGGAGTRALNRAFLELFGRPNAFDQIPVAGRTDPLLLNDAVRRTGLVLDESQRQAFQDRYCDLLEVEILKPNPRKRLMPGVKHLLGRLQKQRDIYLGLLTGNYARAAKTKLKHFGLWSFFFSGAYGEDGAERNDLFPVALKRARALGIVIGSPENVFVVGDTPLDILCAQVGGAQSIAVATGSYDVETLKKKGATIALSDLSRPDEFLSILNFSRRPGLATDSLEG